MDPSKQQPPPPYGEAVGVPPYPTQPGAAPYPTGPGVPPYPAQPGTGGGFAMGPPAPPPGTYYPPQEPPKGFAPQQTGYVYQQQQPIAPAAHSYSYGTSYGQNPVSQGLSGGYDSDAEGLPTQANLSGFGEKAIRRAFIKKVYGILMVQLLLTFGIICLFMFVEPVRDFTRRSPYLYWIAFAVTIVCLIGMACCESVRRTFPTNFIFLGIFTAAEGFMLGTLSARFSVDAIMIAIGITAGVTLGLTVFAFQTKIDFTACGGCLCALLMVLIMMGFFFAFMPSNKYTMIGYGTAGALVFSLYIIYDTQLMMGGKHKYALDPEEYIFAALNIYLDVVNLFLYILMLVGASSSD